MKRTLVIILALSVVFASLTCMASEQAVPENVIDYADGFVVSYLKSFMKSSGFVGSLFESDEEIDALTLGSGYKLYYIAYEEGKPIAESLVPSEQWLFSMDGNEEKVLFSVFEGEELTFEGPENAENFRTVMDILRSLAKKEHVEFEPKLLRYAGRMIAFMEFGEDERVIPIPTSAFKLEEEYLSVTSSKELPSGEELVQKLISNVKTASMQPAGSVGGDFINLHPHLNNETIDHKNPTPALIVALASAAVLVIAGLLIFSRKKRHN